ncbi:hypothetical protein Hanom_Chr14g01291811 [Helianthus anomalus]
MTDPPTRTNARPRGSIQHSPPSLSHANTNGRVQRDKHDIPLCWRLAQGPSAHLIRHSPGYK